MQIAVSLEMNLESSYHFIFPKEKRTSSTFVCPQCGQYDISELSVCVVSHPVKRWSDAGESTAYGTPTVDWQSDYPYSIVGGGNTKVMFECGNCSAQFEHPKRADGESPRGG